MNGRHADAYLAGLVREFCKYPRETEWVEHAVCAMVGRPAIQRPIGPLLDRTLADPLCQPKIEM